MIIRQFVFTLLLVGLCSLAHTQNATSDYIAPITTLSFEQTEFHFGEIVEGEIIQNVVTFTNTGEEPLVISNAKATCGCTIPRWPKEPIMPGETADLLVQFDSKNKGAIKGKINTKRITITANTDPVNSYVTIKGKVFKSEGVEPLPKRQENFDVDASTVKLWPNPTTDLVSLDLSDYNGKAALVETYNILGERLDVKNITKITEQVVQLEMSDYEPGTYTLSISMEGHNRIAKTVIVSK